MVLDHEALGIERLRLGALYAEGAAFLRVRFPSVTPDRRAALSEVRVWAKPAN